MNVLQFVVQKCSTMLKRETTILMDDGKMKVTIQEVNEGEMTVRVENPHFLKSRKGCNLPGIILSMPFISEKDEADIRFGCRQGY